MILVDVSVLTRLRYPEVADVVEPLVEGGSAATCAVIDLQLFDVAGERGRLSEMASLRAASFHWLATADADLQGAAQLQRELLSRPLQACWSSLVVAAVAERHGAVVLHQDRCFDVIHQITVQETRWAVRDAHILGEHELGRPVEPDSVWWSVCRTPCPTCKAPVGYPCRSGIGRRSDQAHVARIRAAEADRVEAGPLDNVPASG